MRTFQKKQRMQQFMQTNYNEWNREKQLEMELATATASILPENMEDSHIIQVLLVMTLSFKKLCIYEKSQQNT